MSVFPVTEHANKISGVFSRPYLVKNAGLKTVYLGQDSSLTVGTQAISMNPGGTLNWAGDTTELWALCAPGETSTLELLYTGDSAFTPGPTSVSIFSDTEELYNATTNFPIGPINILPVTDVSLYSSLLVYVNSPAPLSCSPDCISVVIDIMDSLGNVLLTANPRWNGTGWFTIPLVGTHVRVRGGSSVVLTRDIKILATTAEFERRYYNYPGSNGQIVGGAPGFIDYFETSKFVAADVALGIGVNATAFIPHFSGPSTVNARISGNSVASCWGELVPLIGSSPIWSISTTIAGSSTAGLNPYSSLAPLYLPESPLYWLLNNGAGSAGARRIWFNHEFS